MRPAPPPPLAPEYIPALLAPLKLSQLIPAAVTSAVVPALVARHVVAPWLPRHTVRDTVSSDTKGRGSRSQAATTSSILAAAMTSLSTSVLAKLCAEGDASLSSKVVALGASLPNVRRIVADRHGLPNSLGAVLRAWGSIEEVAVSSDSCGRIINALPRSLTSLNVSGTPSLKNLFTTGSGSGATARRRSSAAVASHSHVAVPQTLGALTVSMPHLTSLRLPTAKRSDLAGLASLKSLRLGIPFKSHDAVLRLLGGPSCVDRCTVVGDDEGSGEAPVTAMEHLTAPLPFLPTLTALSVGFEGMAGTLQLPRLPALRSLGLSVNSADDDPRIAQVLKAFPDLWHVSISFNEEWYTAKYVTVVPAPAPFPALLRKAYSGPPLPGRRYTPDNSEVWQAVLDDLETRPGLTDVVISRQAYFCLECLADVLAAKDAEADAPPAARAEEGLPSLAELRAAMARYRVDTRPEFEPALGDGTDTVGPRPEALTYEEWIEWMWR